MHGDDQGGILRTILDLLAKLGDVHVHGAGERHVVVAPDGVQSPLSGQNLAPVIDHEPQRLELPWGQQEVLPVLERARLAEVDADVAEFLGIRQIRAALGAVEILDLVGHRLDVVRQQGPLGDRGGSLQAREPFQL